MTIFQKYKKQNINLSKFFLLSKGFNNFFMWYILSVKNSKKDSLNSLRKEIQHTHLILIIVITILLTVGGLLINVKANNKAFNQNLQNTSDLITRLYSFMKDSSPQELQQYFDSLTQELTDIDVISIVNTENQRIYHTNHSLIGTRYSGTLPNFTAHKTDFFTEDDIGPSGPQRRTYSAVYDDGQYCGFIMTIMLKKSMNTVTIRTILLFLVVTFVAVLIELLISGTLFKKIKKSFVEFSEDLEGNKYLVDSMRANNHDFTNKLHVILGLIQIGEYDKAVSYIENISIIQRETISNVMKAIDNPSFAALIIGKIARASECNAKFVLKPETKYNSSDIDLPSEALVTIAGNLIDNALDAMNMKLTSSNFDSGNRVLSFGAFTRPGHFLMTIDDTGCGISEDNLSKIFDNGFSTKGDGRGVGLFHTKQLIESLGGKIIVDSTEGVGTTFVVMFGK